MEESIAAGFEEGFGEPLSDGILGFPDTLKWNVETGGNYLLAVGGKRCPLSCISFVGRHDSRTAPSRRRAVLSVEMRHILEGLQ